jgi:hypothetical protein
MSATKAAALAAQLAFGLKGIVRKGGPDREAAA